MKRTFLLLFTFMLFGANVGANAKMIVCIDGGGSKTLLQVIDDKGNVLPLMKKGVVSDRITSGGSNINTVGKEGVEQSLALLIAETYIGKEKMSTILPQSTLYACFAGIGTEENKKQVASILEKMGVNSKKLELLTDADMALKLINGDGAILICGTGSICLGRKAGVSYRVGGLGRVIGDEGSGYQIGLQAIKAALADEYGWGRKTAITAALKELFAVTELKKMVRPVNAGEITPATIATAAPFVFDLAFEGNDLVAQGIIEQAENDIVSMLETMMEKSGLSDCEIHLWGGVFKNSYADHIVQKLTEKASLKRIKIVNQASQNAALLYGRTKIEVL